MMLEVAMVETVDIGINGVCGSSWDVSREDRRWVTYRWHLSEKISSPQMSFSRWSSFHFAVVAEIAASVEETLPWVMRIIECVRIRFKF
jgi:hypothetical protein